MNTTSRVLIVDDRRDVATSFGALLQVSGFEVRPVTDPELALLPVAREFRPDVATIDLGMSRINGYELAARFQEYPALRDVPLIALTAWGTAEDRRRTAAAGFKEHLVKTAGQAALVAATRRCLERSRSS